MTSETQCRDNVVKTLSDVATNIQPKPNVATTSCASWDYKTLSNILLHVPNPALKDVHMLNYGLIKNTNSSYYSGLSLSRTRKGPTNLFETEKVRDRENYRKNQNFY